MMSDQEILALHALPTEVLKERRDQHIDAALAQWSEMPEEVRNAPPFALIKDAFDELRHWTNVLRCRKQARVDKFPTADFAAAALPPVEMIPIEISVKGDAKQ